jgi:hypothetical protein
MSTEGTGLTRAKHLRSTNRTGYQGVAYERRNGKYRAYQMIDGKFFSLGYYDDVNDAGVAASDFRLKYAPVVDAIQKRRSAEKSVKARAAWAKKSAKERSIIARKGKAKMTPEQRSEMVRKMRANQTPQERKEISRKGAAKISPKRRRAIAKRAWATRRRYEEERNGNERAV